ncbi:hypothetical protein OIE67_11175 [Nonomuraea fuscirosea]|uniref:hypothetical protein n=1 Tax=Nonomuraea fuscirosea TaxID=1291556 RepID=UPI002DDA51D6|nr:hypothetical protein [Nonomuraea fuscirosea]WSA55140.1 hypothetical protein OIE67_11175 [Nonomuraea fuscirosea]
MAKTTRTFLLAAAGIALGVCGLCALPPVGGFLLGRAVASVLVFPGLGQGLAAGTAVTLVVYAVLLTCGAYLAFRWSGFGASRIGLLVCWGLAGGPAGVLAVLLWTRGHGVPFDGYARYAASWGMATALLAALLTMAATRLLPAPAGDGPSVPEDEQDPASAENTTTRKGTPGKETPATPRRATPAKKTPATGRKATPAKEPSASGRKATPATGRKGAAAKGSSATGRKRAPRVRERSSGSARRLAFHPRSWVLPCLVAGWAVVWSVLVRDRQPLMAWLPLSLSYFTQVAVVLASIAAGYVEGTLRRRLPVEGRPGRAFVLAWISASVAPVVYAAVVAIDLGMRERLLAAPLNPAWIAEYAADLGAVLVAEPVQVALPPLVLALAAAGVQAVPPLRRAPAGEPDPVRTDRRWALLVAGAALALTYFCLAVTSRFPVLTRRTFDAETPAMVRALALLSPPDPVLGATAVVWSWATTAVFAVATAGLVYVAVRGQLVRLFPASSYVVLVGALALATALAWTVGGVIGRAVTGEEPVGISPAAQATEFAAFVVPVFAALLFIVHSQVGVSRFAKIVDLENEQTWEQATERYRAWRDRTRDHVPSRRERGVIAGMATAGALVPLVLAGALMPSVSLMGAGSAHRLSTGTTLSAGSEVSTAGGLGAAGGLGFPVPSLVGPVADALTCAAYLVLLAGLVFVSLMRVNLRERRWAVWAAVWGASVVAGMAAGLATPAGLLLGLVAGLFAVAGVVAGPLLVGRRRVLVVAGAVLLLVTAVPLVRRAPAGVPLTITTATWRTRAPGLTVEISYPVVAGGPDAARVGAALVAPLRAHVEELLRRHREDPSRDPAPATSPGTSGTTDPRTGPTPAPATGQAAGPKAGPTTGTTADPTNDPWTGLTIGTTPGTTPGPTPGPTTGLVTGGYTVVRNDAGVVSVRYALSGEVGRAVTYGRAEGRVLEVRDLFVPAAFTPAGRRQLAGALRPLMPKGHVPRTVSLDSDRLLVNLAPGAVEFAFGRDYFCAPCAPVTVRVPDARLTGLRRG